MTTFRDQVARTLECTTIASLASFAWFGRAEGQLPRAIARAIDRDTARAHLVEQLQRRLYLSFYVVGRPRANDQAAETSVASGDPTFVRELSAANGAAGGYATGWVTRAVADGELVVERDGITLTAPSEACASIDGGVPACGAETLVRFPNEQFGVSPGHYMALSDAESVFAVWPSRVRIYWNVAPRGAAPLVAQLTSRLNGLGLPFRFKVLNDPAAFTRCDAAVLYLRQSDYEAARPSIAAAAREVAPWLSRDIPAFTKRLWHGIGLAEDPIGRDSFGIHRCRVLARGMVRAFEEARRSPADRLAAVAEQFAAEGISLETPYLNAAGGDDYEPLPLPCVSVRSETTDEAHTIASNGKFSDDQLASHCLQTAAAVGEHLCATALWHGRRCMWIARDLPARGAAGAARDATYATLDAAIYNGTCGVALFLSELAGVTGERRFRDAALAAARQAAVRVDDTPESSRWGLHSGRIGVALGLARIGARWEEPRLMTAARCIVRGAIGSRQESQAFDVLDGPAGGVLGLLAVGELIGQHAVERAAVRLGDVLLASAERAAHGWSWRAPRQPAAQRNLTGYSHGTSGVAHALVELFAVTQDSRYRDAAERAFDYERHWFMRDARNWPDFRFEEGQRRHGRALRSMCAWCHGAPGIAISRSRAAEVLTEAVLQSEANTALDTTEATVRAWIASDAPDLSLCHGLLGNGEILLDASRDAMERDTRRDAARQAVRACVEQVERRVRGAGADHGSLSPGLMVGASGWGYALLRFARNEIPSILAIRREQSCHCSAKEQCAAIVGV